MARPTRCVVAGCFVDCADDASFARLRLRDGVPDPWSPAFASAFPALRLTGRKGSVERTQVATSPTIAATRRSGGGDGGVGDEARGGGSFQVLLLTPAEHAALVRLGRRGLVAHLLGGSLLAPVYAHFTLVNANGHSFALLAAGGPRSSCALACTSGGPDRGAHRKYSEVVEVGAGCRHAKALVLEGRLVPKPGTAGSVGAGGASVKAAYHRGKAYAAAAQLPWRRDATAQASFAKLVAKDAA
jgi:hypothetical protein